MKRLRPSDILYLAILIVVGTLSIALPQDRALVQGIAIGATAVLLVVGFLEYRNRRRHQAAQDPSLERSVSDGGDSPS
ncbi:hypothetical protein DZF92_02545 [Clavibacter michiganensis subsp. insidiosus]|uniref:Integral membrane protein n=1 Tax=Clavibacter michiganensis subsp. insidiosus TaxID=33014 RepID=A0A0D5CF44_9MICO|nr:hypothetical protein VO01_00995 [Clavibacter michiganensis subsp. insidiosus]AWF97072.1 hypothetical protein BEH61_00970 [Clavibacter michiganensis subsp. insidiosus]AWG00140.1 hypothetical protein BEH62_00820 [Clavibacter michiganensis subsp. insidiosus]OQJ58506.1 hypothetical protein B5P21_00285 [Clavibacter michiganensis subsp. insidiosus]RII88570.1 hypothetical protein DZF92_02545 [Clavibacter michiganensis subsp. insidiosus]